MPNPVHWHAYTYTGRSHSDAEIRRGTAPDTYPPVEIKDWLTRPARQIADTFTDVEAAVDWMKQQFTMNPPLGSDDYPLERRLAWIRARLAESAGNDIVYGYYTKAGSYVARALIACPRPDVGSCPKGLA